MIHTANPRRHRNVCSPIRPREVRLEYTHMRETRIISDRNFVVRRGGSQATIRATIRAGSSTLNGRRDAGEERNHNGIDFEDRQNNVRRLIFNEIGRRIFFSQDENSPNCDKVQRNIKINRLVYRVFAFSFFSRESAIRYLSDLN